MWFHEELKYFFGSFWNRYFLKCRVTEIMNVFNQASQTLAFLPLVRRTHSPALKLILLVEPALLCEAVRNASTNVLKYKLMAYSDLSLHIKLI